MKKKWIHSTAVVLLVLAAVFLIAQRIIPVNLADLMSEDFSPEGCRVYQFGWNGDVLDVELTDEETDLLWTLLESLEYRYDGKVPGGIMKGELYHVTLWDLKLPEQVNLFVTKDREIVYLNDREYEMLGDTGPLLEFLGGLQ